MAQDASSIHSYRMAVLGLLLISQGQAQIQNQPDDGQWIMAAKNYASTRFSTLDQINTGNAHSLKLAWTCSIRDLTSDTTKRYASFPLPGSIAMPPPWGFCIAALLRLLF